MSTICTVSCQVLLHRAAGGHATSWGMKKLERLGEAKQYQNDIVGFTLTHSAGLRTKAGVLDGHDSLTKPLLLYV